MDRRGTDRRAPALMTSADIAAYLKVPATTPRQWRRAGTGPPWVRVGRHIRYCRADLDLWLAAQRQD